MRKAWIIARHEFLVTVRRAWFVIACIVLPLVFLGIGGGMTLLGRRVVEDSRKAVAGKPLGVIDRWGELASTPRDFGIRRFPGEESARGALRSKEIGAYISVPPDYLETGRVRVVTSRRPTLLTAERLPLPDGLEPWLIENILRKSEPGRVARAQAPLFAEPAFVDETGGISTEDALQTARRSTVAYGFCFLLLMSIFTSSAYLLQGTAEEKENRVMEIILSSVTPEELMAGKLMGLGAAGLLQLTIWTVMGVAGAAAFVGGLALEPAAYLFCLVFFLLGYVLYGSLMLGFGALGTNFRESQQMASVWSLLGASPLFIVFALFEAPQGALSRVFSLVPFTSPMTMMFRYAIDPRGTPALDIAASILLLLATAILSLRLSARLFRAGLLLYGKRPGLREIWRWIREA